MSAMVALKPSCKLVCNNSILLLLFDNIRNIEFSEILSELKKSKFMKQITCVEGDWLADVVVVSVGAGTLDDGGSADIGFVDACYF